MKKTICPNCGYNPVMSVPTRILLFYRHKARCPNCKIAVSNPSWFDIMRIISFLAFTIWNAPYVYAFFAGAEYSKIICLLFDSGFYLVWGLIALFFIPLQKHWNATDDK